MAQQYDPLTGWYQDFLHNWLGRMWGEEGRGGMGWSNLEQISSWEPLKGILGAISGQDENVARLLISAYGVGAPLWLQSRQFAPELGMKGMGLMSGVYDQLMSNWRLQQQSEEGGGSFWDILGPLLSGVGYGLGGPLGGWFGGLLGYGGGSIAQ